jgi:hypothetical protein
MAEFEEDTVKENTHSAFWLPPGSIRAVIALSFVGGTFWLVNKVLAITVALETHLVQLPDGTTQKVMAYSDATTFIGVMGALSVIFALTGIVVQHYFGNAQNTDMFNDLRKLLKK